MTLLQQVHEKYLHKTLEDISSLLLYGYLNRNVQPKEITYFIFLDILFILCNKYLLGGRG